MITIFGESAGGNSVMNHVARSSSSPYFERAIIQSGSYSEGAWSMEAAGVLYPKLLTGTECTNLACLRGLDATTIAEKIKESSPFQQYFPAVDGVELTMTPMQMIEQGSHNKKAIVI